MVPSNIPRQTFDVAAWPILGGRVKFSSEGGMAPAPTRDYLSRMAENDKPRGLTKGRLFILIFFGIAAVLSITTILGTWDEQKNGVVDPSAMNNPLTAPAK